MGKKSSAGRMPKTKCCVSKSKCGRCPLRMLKEGTLPEAFAVKKRLLVHVDSQKPVKKDDLKKAAKAGKGRKVVVVKAASSKKGKKSGRKGSRLAAAA